MGGLYRRHLAAGPAPYCYLGLRWEVAQPLLDASGLEPNIQLQQPLPNQANVQNLALHPVYVRTGSSGSFYDGLNFRYAPYWSANGGIAGVPSLQTVRDGRMGSRLIDTNYGDFAPRIGIAYSPSDKWSIRAGYGIFYSMESKNSIFDLARGMVAEPPPWRVPPIRRRRLLTRIPQYGIASGDRTHQPHLGCGPTPAGQLHPAIRAHVQRTVGKSSTFEAVTPAR